MPNVCSICRLRGKDKLAAGYWAWFPAPNDRRSYRVLYCVGDADYLQSALHQWSHDEHSLSTNPETNCWNCGTDMGNDLWLVTYATIFLPKRERMAVEFWGCETCQITLRSHVIEYGHKLPDRPMEVFEPRAREDPWSRLIPDR